MNRDDVLIIDGKASDWKEAIHLTGQALLEKGFVKEGFAEGCIRREKNYPTGLLMETCIAIPHTEDTYVNKAGICMLRLDEEVSFCRMDAPEETISTKLIFNLALEKGSQQVGMLQKLITAMADQEFAKQCITLNGEALKQLFANYSLCE